MKNYKRFENETDEELLFRLGGSREQDGLNWIEFGKVMNELTGQEYTESKWRKQYSTFDKMFNANKKSLVGAEYVNGIDEKQESLYKQEIKTRDRLREYKNTLRDEARIETIIDAIKYDAETYHIKLNPFSGECSGTKEAILMISDWHIGDCVSNFRNDFNLDILQERVNEIQDATIKYCRDNHVYKLNVVNLGDLINGQIHVNARVENQIDVVRQVKYAVRILCTLLANLSDAIEFVTYRSVLDNHSRVNVNIKEHIEKESFSNIIDWWVSDKLESINKDAEYIGKNEIEFISDNIDENIGVIKINNKTIPFAHGHLESKTATPQNFAFGMNIVPDAVLLAHYHTDEVKNFQGCKTYFNGSLKGTDSFALNHRLFGNPSQTLLIFDGDTVFDIPIPVKSGVKIK